MRAPGPTVRRILVATVLVAIAAPRRDRHPPDRHRCPAPAAIFPHLASRGIQADMGPSPLARYRALRFGRRIGPELERGLAALEARVEGG